MNMLSPEGMTVLKARYLQKNETPEAMFWRVANYVAQAEELFGQDTAVTAAKYYELLSGLNFLPNSPTLMNAGKPQAQMAACFVLPIEDSLGGIFDTLKNAALIHQSGGGTGFSFSRLRPKGDQVATTAGTAGGPVSFLRIFDVATEVVKQGAVRSGANMAILRVDHPDIMEFITAKRQQNILNNFNLSVGITDDFMAAVVGDTAFELINPRNKQVVQAVQAQQVFAQLVEMAWENGEPGLFFLDSVNRANPTPQLGMFESPNPCSEQPLLPYESCTLGSIQLGRMLAIKGKKREIDYARLRQTVRTAVRFLDNVVEINAYPLTVVADATRLTRKIGLGIMGLADVLIMLDLPYASKSAVELTSRLMRFITSEARVMSMELAQERGSFPAFDRSIFAGQGIGALRNATMTTIAPTGSISMIANCSSGIEPLFALAFTRHVLDGRELTSTNPVVLTYLEERGLLTAEVLSIINSQGSVREADLPLVVKSVLATAHEIAPFWHVAQLAAAQRYTDNGVSKTVNMPHDALLADVARIFQQAYTSGCKGVTVYRDSSRHCQVLTHGTVHCAECEL
ncbi:MAG TPA: adenosylcobalamin-dependent ribonucleoside-diphosphate reductase, partial [Negativicutes bacterium]